MKLKALIPVVLGFAAVVPTMSASIVGPGAFASPDLFTTLAGFTPIANTGLINVNPTPGASFNATYDEVVGRDTNNMLCGVAGQCITFVIDLVNSGPGVVERVSSADFGAFITDLGYNTDTPTPGGIVPATVDRSASGSVVGFNFNTGTTNINAGQRAARLEIQTSALYYTAGTVSVQDGVAGFGVGFAPTNTTPEPASMLFFGTGLIGIGMTKRFYKSC